MPSICFQSVSCLTVSDPVSDPSGAWTGDGFLHASSPSFPLLPPPCPSLPPSIHPISRRTLPFFPARKSPFFPFFPLFFDPGWCRGAFGHRHFTCGAATMEDVIESKDFDFAREVGARDAREGVGRDEGRNG